MLVETLSDLGEADAALAAAREVAPDLPVVVTMSFDTNLRTMMGVRPGDAVTHLAAAGADAVGPTAAAAPRRWRSSPRSWRRPAPATCSSSRSRTPASRRWSATTSSTTPPPADLAAHAGRLAELGIDLVGGCCGSTPAHIAAMGDEVAPA